VVRHYFSDMPVSKPKKMEITAELRGYSLNLVTYSGIFSFREIDKGTRLLAETMLIPESGRFLDLGCGYGVVGIIAGLENPDLEIWFIDTNRLAIMATKQNAKRYLRKFKVLKNDGLKGIDVSFNAIATNPPFSAGKETVFRFIDEGFANLVPGGWMDVVARKSKGGKSLKEKMMSVFGNVEVAGRGSGYQVYRSFKIDK